MPRRKIQLDLDYVKNNNVIKFNAKQFEDIEIQVTIIENKAIYDLENSTVEFYCDKQLEYTVEVVDNVVIIVIESESVIEEGIYKCELIIDDSEGTLKIPTFYFYVHKSLSGNVIIELKTLLDSDGNTLLDSNGNTLKVRR